MSSRDFASSLIAPMSVDPSRSRSSMTLRMPKFSKDSGQTAEIAANPRESYRIPGIFASRKHDFSNKIQCVDGFRSDTKYISPIFLVQVAATRRSLQSRKSAQRLFSMQHLTASRALAPAFDQRHPARLKRLPTVCLQALSTTPDPTGNPRFR